MFCLYELLYIYIYKLDEYAYKKITNKAVSNGNTNAMGNQRTDISIWLAYVKLGCSVHYTVKLLKWIN